MHLGLATYKEITFWTVFNELLNTWHDYIDWPVDVSFFSPFTMHANLDWLIWRYAVIQSHYMQGQHTLFLFGNNILIYLIWIHMDDTTSIQANLFGVQFSIKSEFDILWHRSELFNRSWLVNDGTQYFVSRDFMCVLLERVWCAYNPCSGYTLSSIDYTCQRFSC